ncbi:transposon Ty3-I Gag-Pol polyprotein [Trichonephila clavipes]|nr:transposon Ty3-I Gag-Pol polyprotein [Trichonephila clavipes]
MGQDEFKGEILLNLLGEKAENILVYVKDEEISDYDKLKSLVLREFEPTPLICLQNFQKAKRMPNEAHVQLASRLLTNWDQYCNLRNVNDFNSLKELIVSDNLYETNKILNEPVMQLVLPRYRIDKPNMSGEITEFVQTCKGCHLRKPEKIGDRAPITHIVRPELPFEIVNIDMIGPI